MRFLFSVLVVVATDILDIELVVMVGAVVWLRCCAIGLRIIVISMFLGERVAVNVNRSDVEENLDAAAENPRVEVGARAVGLAMSSRFFAGPGERMLDRASPCALGVPLVESSVVFWAR